jgi:hypothetical protein
MSGALRTVEFCASAIFGSTAYETRTPSDALKRGADIRVTDHLIYGLRADKPCGIRSPQWVRQELLLGPSWEETLASLRTHLRKEISRLLRKYGYRISTASGQACIDAFRRDFLLPNLNERYGSAAIVAADDAFMRECRDMTRLNLHHEDSIVAASLVEIEGTRLMIRKSAVKPGLKSLRGRSDILDYYCLLLAQLAGCRTLDFGLSRPHLEDGTLRYKSKWGTRIVPAGGLKARIRIDPLRFTAATRAFLRRSYFLQRDAQGFVVRILYDDASRPDAVNRLQDLAEIGGPLRSELLCPAGATPPDLTAIRGGNINTCGIFIPKIVATDAGPPR